MSTTRLSCRTGNGVDADVMGPSVFPMCLTTTVRPSCRTCNDVYADGMEPSTFRCACPRRSGRVAGHATEWRPMHGTIDFPICLTTMVELLNMQRCGCRWHGTIDFQMCLTTTAELQEVQRCECRWHGTIDVSMCRTKQSGRVAGHATMLMPVA